LYCATWYTVRTGAHAPGTHFVGRYGNAPDITTTKGLRDRAIIAVPLGRALRQCNVAARTDGRSLGGFTPEVIVATPRANATRAVGVK